MNEHELDALQSRMRAVEVASEAAGRAKAALDHSMATGERVAVLERERELIDEKLDKIEDGQKLVLVEIGKLTERGRFDRLLQRAVQFAALFGLGSLGLWVAYQFLTKVPG